MGSKSVIDPSNLRTSPDGLNITTVDNVTSPNQTQGMFTQNNIEIELHKYFSSSDNAFDELKDNIEYKALIKFVSEERDKEQ